MFTSLDFFKDRRSGGIWGSDQEGGRSGIILQPRLQIAPGPVLSSEPVELPKEWCSYRLLGIIRKIYEQIRSIIPNHVLSDGEGLRMHGINEPVRPERSRRATLFLATRLSASARTLVLAVCFALLAMTSLFITGAHGDPIIKNELEDINILISTVIGGQPNVLIIYDNSLSMGDNFGLDQLGNWDADSVITRCEFFQNIKSPPQTPEVVNAVRAHCIGNASGTNPCGSTECTGSRTGTCEEADDFERFLQCIQTKYPALFGGVYDTVVPNACPGGITTDPSTECTTDTERAHAAAAIENEALKQTGVSANFNCGAENCVADADKSCNLDTGTPGSSTREYTNYKDCMNSLRIQPTSTACANGQLCSKGIFGSTRMDMTQAAIFDLLDANDSLAGKMCDDPKRLFDDVNTSIKCSDFMFTPFRDVGQIAKGTGAGSKLPLTGLDDTAMINELTQEDTDILGIIPNIMQYGGLASSVTSCTDEADIDGDQGGFAGGSIESISKVWRRARGLRAGGRSPMALALGFDDSNLSSDLPPLVKEDALNTFDIALKTDIAISCRAEFIVLITDGGDTCSGDCAVLPGSCPCPEDPTACLAAVTGNANRRSSIQASSNARTFYARDPVVNGNFPGQVFKKEILIFVIGIGINDPEDVRALNGVALTGGTHTTGIIKHVDASGNFLGAVDIDDTINNPFFSGLPAVFKKIAKATGIVPNPSNAQLQGCLAPDVDENNGVCSYQGTDVFDNTYFNTSIHLTIDSTVVGESFAFFVNTAEDFLAALQSISGFVSAFSTSGASPATPQSVAQFTSRDRAFVSILTPLAGERIWQGRLGLYGFIDDPTNPNAKIIVDKDKQEIFDVSGSLNLDAQDFFWEAGKLLAEGDPTTRRLFSVNTIPPGDPNPDPGELDTTTVDVFTSGIRYKGELADFDTNLPPELFGISDADVTDPIPTFCTSACNPATTCSIVTDPACITCVKDCIRDKVVSFMRGDTEIQAIADPMGVPTTESQADNSMGVGCPDPDAGTGDLEECSVRLGPVFHGSPIIVGSPSPIFFDVGFQNFAKAFRNRTGVVYAAANDGFIHAFNAGDFVDTTDSTLSPTQKTNPFTLEVEAIPFFTAGDGTELFGFAPPSFHPDAIAPLTKDPETPPSGGTPPDYRFGDFKTFVVDNQFERSFMDGTPLIADLYIDGEQNGIQDNASCSSTPGLDGVIDPCGKEWHTVLLAGYRNGGGAYTALDVTNVDRIQTGFKKFSTGPDYPRHLWTVFDKNFGNTWSEPTIGRVRMLTEADGNVSTVEKVDRWVMFVGGGLDPLDTDPTEPDTGPAGVNFGNAFYAIDVTTGKIIFKLAKDATSAPNGTVFDTRMVCEMSSKVGAFDYNADGFIDIVLVGDTCGRLWRIDTSEEIVDNVGDISTTGLRGDADIRAPNWTADIAFCATADFTQCENPGTIPFDPVTLISQRQPIFFAPTVVLDDLGRRHVIFVTGNRRHPSSAGDFGKLYNFIDEYRPSFLGGGSAVTTKTEADFTPIEEIIDLVPQGGFAQQFTTSGGSNVQGEFIVNFPSNIPTVSGEKGFGSPVVINSVLAFTTFDPDPNLDNPCSGGIGNGRVFALDYLTGESALARIPGAQSLILGSESEQAQTAGLTVASGMPTPAQLTFGPSGNVVFTLAFSGSAALGGSSFLVWEFARLPANTSTHFWEEIF